MGLNRGDWWVPNAGEAGRAAGAVVLQRENGAGSKGEWWQNTSIAMHDKPVACGIVENQIGDLSRSCRVGSTLQRMHPVASQLRTR